MREIKFRAWNSKKPEMLFLGNLTEANWDIKFIFKRYKIMQYTGLKDKNGKEIWEGDVVTGFGANGVVEWFNNLSWDSGGSLHPGFYCYEWMEYKSDGELSYHYGFDECEVLGNIYENPELLKDVGHD